VFYNPGFKPMPQVPIIAAVLFVYLLADDKNNAAPSTDHTSAWLTFASSLVWQFILIYVLLAYRRPIGLLFEKLSRLKFAGVEGEFQAQVSDKPLPTKGVIEVKSLDAEGFLTQDGVKQIVESSGLLQPSEAVNATLLLFRTPRQRTWLVSTGRNIFCILDDARTKAKSTLIQWKQPADSIERVKAYRTEDGSPVVDIGDHEGWLYSPILHPDPRALEDQIRSMLTV
jgi:hypothetical protein